MSLNSSNISASELSVQTSGVGLTTKGKAALQELLKYGWIEQSYKPNIYQTLIAQQRWVNQALAPLDLQARSDEVRGLIFIVVKTDEASLSDNGIGSLDSSFDSSVSTDTNEVGVVENQLPHSVAHDANESDDEWTHPLIRRQRLTLEQSLLLAILRQIFVEGEQQQGIGSSDIYADLDEMQSQIEVYLGSSGSDAEDERKLRGLLEQLYGYGVVSKIDSQQRVLIRPLIAHVASPSTLTNLLVQLAQLSDSD